MPSKQVPAPPPERVQGVPVFVGVVPQTPRKHVASTHSGGAGQSAAVVHDGPGGGLPATGSAAAEVIVGADHTATAPAVPIPIFFSAVRREIPVSAMATPFRSPMIMNPTGGQDNRLSA